MSVTKRQGEPSPLTCPQPAGLSRAQALTTGLAPHAFTFSPQRSPQPARFTLGF